MADVFPLIKKEKRIKMYQYTFYLYSREYYSGDIEDERDFYIFHKNLFSIDEFRNHIIECLPELMDFIVNEYNPKLIKNERQRLQFQIDRLTFITDEQIIKDAKHDFIRVAKQVDDDELMQKGIEAIRALYQQKIKDLKKQQDDFKVSLDFNWNAEYVQKLNELMKKKFGYKSIPEATSMSLDMDKLITENYDTRNRDEIANQICYLVKEYKRKEGQDG